MALLVLATHNAGKVAELSSLLGPLGYDIRSSAEMGVPSPVEDGQTFLDNARIKARAVRSAPQIPVNAYVLADDSGLSVGCLGGKPGVQTSEFGGFAKLLEVMADDRENRSAFFSCILVLLAPDGTETVVEGRVDGAISAEARGIGGFGYDPVFIPENQPLTFAEMDKAAKSSVSHRGRALRKLLEYLV